MHSVSAGQCVFCKMPDSEIRRRVYEDRVCSVIINRYPVEKGHLLVISKAHYADMLSTPDSVITHMFRVAKRFGRVTKNKLKCMGMDIGVNIGGAGSIHHFHIHILPRYSNRLLHFGPGKDEIQEKEIREVRQLLKL
jgi:histidine triad (HIT) family protein